MMQPLSGLESERFRATTATSQSIGIELPATDHPVIPQNLYRMGGGADNAERFEQIGQSWMKHAFFALEEFICGPCNTNPPCVTGDQLCPGCADTYVVKFKL